MENIMIDTCVFFRMIEYNNFAMKYGKENVGKLIEHNKQVLANKETEINEFINKTFPNFFEQNKDLEYNDLILKFSNEKITNEVSRFSKAIESWESLKNNDKIPPERKALLKQNKEKAEEIIKKYNQIDEWIKNYKTEKQSIKCGQIFKQAVDGKIKLFSNTVSFSEILEHSKKLDKENWVYYPLEDITNLSKNMVSIVTTKSKQPFLKDEEKETDLTLGAIEYLAEQYRTPSTNENQKNMGNDKNILGDYGDSKIAAFASMAGMTFVTINGKDFIFDLDKNYKNEDIRNHINEINKICQYATDAQAISIDEFLENNYKRPTIQKNHMCSLEKVQKAIQDERFVEEHLLQI